VSPLNRFRSAGPQQACGSVLLGLWTDCIYNICMLAVCCSFRSILESKA
jgi:hypothetical protein